MAKHNETGIKGEQIAEKFLLRKGYAILHSNWRFGHKEVDIIAEKDNVLIFAEVKTRSGYGFGFPEEAVNIKKQQFLKLAAEAFLEINPRFSYARFDTISILLEAGLAKEIVHFEDAFY
jgi:putative endonuclease